MRIKLTVEYDGTNYAGWQRQLGVLTVQEALERAFEQAAGERVAVCGAGRTDAGVHAEAQVAHLDTHCTIPPEKISYAMNMHLPPDIRVRRSERAADDFHARFCAKGKTYRYTVYNATHAPAICRLASAHVRGALDMAAICDAAVLLRGTHDFAPFSASGSEVKDTVRTVYDVSVAAAAPFVYIDVTGSGFLYHMVRIIAGTLIEVGLGKRRPGSVEEILKGRDKAGATAPAKGLTLKAVYYDTGMFGGVTDERSRGVAE